MTSSHYYLAYRIDIARDFIEFNFSVPKYLYGSNIFQFVPHPGDVNYREDFSFSTGYVDITFQRLMMFISDFIYERFPGIRLNDSDIEVNRIDLCYNQIFEKKEHALQYLDYQKRIRKKYLRKTSKNRHAWETSIFITTERYSAKIYHKGSEYKSGNGEMSHHRKINRDNKEDIFQVDNEYDEKGNLVKEGFHSIADRILRYEITFRSSFMSHLYKKHYFARKCGKLQQIKKDYKHARKIKRKCENEAKKHILLNYLSPEGEKAIREKYMKEFNSLPKDVRKNFKRYESIMNHRLKFFLAINKQEKEQLESVRDVIWDKKGKIKMSDKAPFNYLLFRKLVKEFTGFMEQFKLDKKEKLNSIDQKLMEYNTWAEKNGEKKMSETRIKKFLSLLKDHTIDELVENGVISKRTKYNVMNDFKKLDLAYNGFNSKYLENDTEDYKKYFNLKLQN